MSNLTLVVCAASLYKPCFTVCYSQKGFRQQTIHTLEPVGGQLEMPLTPTPTAVVRSPLTYRRYGTVRHSIVAYRNLEAVT